MKSDVLFMVGEKESHKAGHILQMWLNIYIFYQIMAKVQIVRVHKVMLIDHNADKSKHIIHFFTDFILGSSVNQVHEQKISLMSRIYINKML